MICEVVGWLDFRRSARLIGGYAVKLRRRRRGQGCVYDQVSCGRDAVASPPSLRIHTAVLIPTPSLEVRTQARRARIWDGHDPAIPVGRDASPVGTHVYVVTSVRRTRRPATSTMGPPQIQ